jgi:hypothetical protein
MGIDETGENGGAVASEQARAGGYVRADILLAADSKDILTPDR